jgi:hypothetical protein
MATVFGTMTMEEMRSEFLDRLEFRPDDDKVKDTILYPNSTVSTAPLPVYACKTQDTFVVSPTPATQDDDVMPPPLKRARTVIEDDEVYPNDAGWIWAEVLSDTHYHRMRKYMLDPAQELQPFYQLVMKLTTSLFHCAKGSPMAKRIAISIRNLARIIQVTTFCEAEFPYEGTREFRQGLSFWEGDWLPLEDTPRTPETQYSPASPVVFIKQEPVEPVDDGIFAEDILIHSSNWDIVDDHSIKL